MVSPVLKDRGKHICFKNSLNNNKFKIKFYYIKGKLYLETEFPLELVVTEFFSIDWIFIKFSTSVFSFNITIMQIKCQGS